MNLNRSIRVAALAAWVGLSCAVISQAADEPLPSPNASRQEVPRGNASVGAPSEPILKVQPNPAKARDDAARDPSTKDESTRDEANSAPKKRALIAPPSLLSRAPTLPTYTAPGLGKLNLNRATIEQLQRLPGVGLTWAPRILAGRPYRTLGDLARDGIPFTVIDSLSQEVELGP